jgi:hypothetical protein
MYHEAVRIPSSAGTLRGCERPSLPPLPARGAERFLAERSLLRKDADAKCDLLQDVKIGEFKVNFAGRFCAFFAD